MNVLDSGLALERVLDMGTAGIHDALGCLSSCIRVLRDLLEFVLQRHTSRSDVNRLGDGVSPFLSERFHFSEEVLRLELR